MIGKIHKGVTLKNVVSFFFVCLTLLAGSVETASAKWTAPSKPDNVPASFDTAIINMTNWILGFVASIAVLAIIWGGVNYLTSAGNESQAENGKNTIKYGIMGLVICGIAYALVVVIVTVILV